MSYNIKEGGILSCVWQLKIGCGGRTETDGGVGERKKGTGKDNHGSESGSSFCIVPKREKYYSNSVDIVPIIEYTVLGREVQFLCT